MCMGSKRSHSHNQDGKNCKRRRVGPWRKKVNPISGLSSAIVLGEVSQAVADAVGSVLSVQLCDHHTTEKWGSSADAWWFIIRELERLDEVTALALFHNTAKVISPLLRPIGMKRGTHASCYNYASSRNPADFMESRGGEWGCLFHQECYDGVALRVLLTATAPVTSLPGVTTATPRSTGAFADKEMRKRSHTIKTDSTPNYKPRKPRKPHKAHVCSKCGQLRKGHICPYANSTGSSQ